MTFNSGLIEDHPLFKEENKMYKSIVPNAPVKEKNIFEAGNVVLSRTNKNVFMVCGSETDNKFNGVCLVEGGVSYVYGELVKGLLKKFFIQYNEDILLQKVKD